MGQIQSAGQRRGPDAYHNQFLDTSSILEETLKKGLRSKNIKTSSTNKQASESDDPDQTLKDFGIKTGISEKAIEHVSSLKEAMVALYQEYGSHALLAGKIEKMIRRVEDAQISMGLEPEPFDPLKNRSGLEAMEQLENADKVVANTLSHYKMFSVSSIKAFASPKGPAIDVQIFGDSGEMGFEISATVIAEEDFDGNEAIDYVYSQNGGLMSIKARSQGTWKDVSEKFIINCSVKRYKLSETEENVHSAFIGEKIISEGKEKIVQALNINSEDVKFGKCRVFSKNREIVDNIRTLVRVNKL